MLRLQGRSHLIQRLHIVTPQCMRAAVLVVMQCIAGILKNNHCDGLWILDISFISETILLIQLY